MKLEAIKDQDNWNRSIQQIENSLFFKYEWYKAFKTPWKSNLLVRLENCFLPLQINLLTRVAYSGPWGSYGGPIGNKNLTEEILKCAKKKLFLRKIVLYCEEEFPLKIRNYSLERSSAVILTLDNEENVLKRLHENRERNLKKAAQGGFYFEILIGKEGAIRYTKLLKRVLKGVKGYKFHNIGIFKNLSELEEVHFCFSGKERDESGAVILEVNKDTIFYWHGVNSAEALSQHIGDFLHWSILQFALKKGFKFYNLGTSPYQELRNYKLSWGGEEKPVYTYVI